MMISSSFVIRFTMIAALIHLTGCSTRQQPITPSSPTVTTITATSKTTETPVIKPFKVALLVPLTNEHKDIGHALQRAAELALFQNHDIALDLLVKDTQGHADGARKAAMDAVKDNADVILGPLLAPEVTAVAAVINKRIPILAFSNNQSIAQHQVFALGHNPAEQVRRVLRYAATRGIQDIIVVAPQNDYGKIVTQVVNDLNSQRLIKTVARLSSDPVLLAESLFKFNDLKGKGIFIAEDDRKTAQILQRLKARGINFDGVTLLGTSLWNPTGMANDIHFNGALFSACVDDQRLSFEQLYQQTYQVKSPKIASLAYDAMAVIAASVQTDLHKIDLLKLGQDIGFTGVDGIFRLTVDGHVERGYAIYEMFNGTVRIAEPAPTQF